MKVIKWLLGLFKKKEIEPIPTPDTKPNIPEIPDTSKPSKKFKVAVVRGHGTNDSGASDNGTNEVEYNTWVMERLEGMENVKCFYGRNSIDAITKSIPWSADLTIQLHLNSAGPTAHGCEVLALKGDEKSYPFAEKFASDFCAKFTRKMRGEKGKKLLDSSDRGYTSLKLTLMGAKILVEPFFLSNKEDMVAKEEYLEFLKQYIKEVQK
jgi:N-acetylmuramoyl-L-alanine amidase